MRISWLLLLNMVLILCLVCIKFLFSYGVRSIRLKCLRWMSGFLIFLMLLLVSIFGILWILWLLVVWCVLEVIERVFLFGIVSLSWLFFICVRGGVVLCSNVCISRFGGCESECFYVYFCLDCLFVWLFFYGNYLMVGIIGFMVI